MTFSLSRVVASAECGRSNYKEHQGSKTAPRLRHILDGLKTLIGRYQMAWAYPAIVKRINRWPTQRNPERSRVGTGHWPRDNEQGESGMHRGQLWH